MRIVSLLPAATDSVVTLGLESALVGRTHECDWPPGQLAGAAVVTRTTLDGDGLNSREISAAVAADRRHGGSSLYTLDAARLAALAPDLVLTQELCDVCAVSYRQVAAAVRIADTGPRVVSLEPRTLGEVLDSVRMLGELTDRAWAGDAAVRTARERLAAVAAAVAGVGHRPRVAVLEWLDPVWPAGHWVPEQVAAAGGTPLLAGSGTHTAPIEWSRVVDAAPEVLVLAPCGFPPARTLRELPAVTGRPGWADLPAVRSGQVWVVDGPAYFNRPGPRLVRGVEVLAAVLHGIGELLPGEAIRVGAEPTADPPPLPARLRSAAAVAHIRAAAESGRLRAELAVGWQPHLGDVLARVQLAAGPDRDRLWPVPLAALVHEEPAERVPALLAEAGLAAETPQVLAIVTGFGEIWRDPDPARYAERHGPDVERLLLFEAAHEGRVTPAVRAAAAHAGLVAEAEEWDRRLRSPQL